MNDTARRMQTARIEVGDHVQIGSFHRWYTVIALEEPTLLVLESDAGAHIKAYKQAVSAVRKAQALAAKARDLAKRT